MEPDLQNGYDASEFADELYVSIVPAVGGRDIPRTELINEMVPSNAHA